MCTSVWQIPQNFTSNLTKYSDTFGRFIVNFLKSSPKFSIPQAVSSYSSSWGGGTGAGIKTSGLENGSFDMTIIDVHCKIVFSNSTRNIKYKLLKRYGCTAVRIKINKFRQDYINLTKAVLLFTTIIIILLCSILLN